MHLLLLRHGDALSGFVDSQRPLSKLGRDEVRRAAEWMAEHGPRPAEIQHSGILRAAQTAEIVREVLELSPDVVRRVPGIEPGDDPRHQAVVVRHDPRNLLLCSHMPFLALLAGELLGDDAAPAAGFPTAWLVHLERTGDGPFELRAFRGPPA